MSMTNDYDVYVASDSEPNVSVETDSNTSVPVNQEQEANVSVETDADISLDAELDNEALLDVPVNEGVGEVAADHRRLLHRDAARQHPISAIDGLSDALAVINEAIRTGFISTGDAIAAVQVETAGKNTVYHASTQPTGGDYKIGDTWFNSSESYCMYTWNGSTWVREQFGNAAFANACITNALIANGAITNAKIEDGTIKSAKIESLVVEKISGIDRLVIGQSQVEDLSDDLADMLDDIAAAALEASGAATAASDAAKTATNYLTAITGQTGICVHDAGDVSNFVNVNSSGMSVYKGGSSVASFGSTATIRTNPNSPYKVYIDGDQLDIRYNDYYAVIRLAGDNTNGGQILAYDKGHTKHGLLSCDVVSTSYTNGRISIQGSSDGGGLYDSNIGSNGGYLIKSSSTGKYVQLNTKAYSETLSTYETLRINSNGTLGISGSSRRWKKDIRYLADDSMNVQKDEILNGIRKLSASIFKYKEKPERNPDIDWDTDSDNLGFIAEDVAKYLPQAAIFDHQDESIVNDWSERNIIPAILLLAQEAMNRVEALERGVK